jgi:hypothetical protein
MVRAASLVARATSIVASSWSRSAAYSRVCDGAHRGGEAE